MTSSGVAWRKRRRVVDQHHEHLCRLAERFYHVHEPLKFRAMVADPQFKCEFCGRAAADACHLCYPTPL